MSSTIRDIAKIANVSIATVSYVINNRGQISDKTKEKVMRAVKELNYQPNNIAKSLKSKKTNTIGIITEDITVFNAPEIIDGINKYTEEIGYNIILNNLRLSKKMGNNYYDTKKYDKEIQRVVKVLLSSQIEGLIYIGLHNRNVENFMKNSDLPVVYTYCYSPENLYTDVNYNDQLAAYEATEYLIKKGHKKIAVITGMVNSMPCQERLKGYQMAISYNNLIYNPTYIKVGNWEYESGYKMAKELLLDDDRPTAIFVMNDIMAGGAIDAANEIGIKIPQDLSLIGFDNRDCSFYYVPKLTTMEVPLSEMGIRTAKILIDIINNKNEEVKSVKLKCNLIERGSVRDINEYDINDEHK
jgi:LacI family transcriptional regulator